MAAAHLHPPRQFNILNLQHEEDEEVTAAENEDGEPAYPAEIPVGEQAQQGGQQYQHAGNHQHDAAILRMENDFPHVGLIHQVFCGGGAVVPGFGDALGAALRHLHQGKALAHFHADLLAVISADFKYAPEAGFLHLFHPGVNLNLIAHEGGALVLHLVAHQHQVAVLLNESDEVDTDVRGHLGAAFFDPAQVSQVVHHAAAVGVVVHDIIVENKLRVFHNI